jgi:hypothetical protein
MDPLTLSTAAVGAYLSKDGVARLLGPTADYLGGELKDLVEKSRKNLASVFIRAERKCGERIDEAGAVNPRVLKHVYDEARFSEDDLLAEYFAGVLASSRTTDGKDDQGVYYSQIVKSLSAHQIRMHYFLYYLIWLHSNGRAGNLYAWDERQKLSLVVPASVYEETFHVADRQKEMVVIAHSLAGLSRLDLIDESFRFEKPERLRDIGLDVDEHAFVVSPSITGLELFTWVHGRGIDGIDAFKASDLVLNPEIPVESAERVMLKG